MQMKNGLSRSCPGVHNRPITRLQLPFARQFRRYQRHLPQHSLILIKPTRPTDAGGDVSDYYATHNGGQRWKGNESGWQYKTILEWIRGARLETAQTQSGGGSR